MHHSHSDVDGDAFDPASTSGTLTPKAGGASRPAREVSTPVAALEANRGISRELSRGSAPDGLLFHSSPPSVASAPLQTPAAADDSIDGLHAGTLPQRAAAGASRRPASPPSATSGANGRPPSHPQSQPPKPALRAESHAHLSGEGRPTQPNEPDSADDSSAVWPVSASTGGGVRRGGGGTPEQGAPGASKLGGAGNARMSEGEGLGTGGACAGLADALSETPPPSARNHSGHTGPAAVGRSQSHRGDAQPPPPPSHLHAGPRNIRLHASAAADGPKNSGRNSSSSSVERKLAQEQHADPRRPGLISGGSPEIPAAGGLWGDVDAFRGLRRAPSASSSGGTSTLRPVVDFGGASAGAGDHAKRDRWLAQLAAAREASCDLRDRQRGLRLSTRDLVRRKANHQVALAAQACVVGGQLADARDAAAATQRDLAAIQQAFASKPLPLSPSTWASLVDSESKTRYFFNTVANSEDP
ncbi:hypothetical protein DIPPA_16651 [Diplonema papillatum]|nr:hypothetical protein DIPPA_16651 [Diplonema papillatum]